MDNPRYIDPFSDIGFKALFGREGQSEVILKEFLNEVFKGQPQFDEIKEVSFINTERTKEDENDKTIIHDILCTTDSGHRFIVEMQKGVQSNFLLRAIYYVSRGITDQAVRTNNDQPWQYDLLPVAGVFVTTFPVKGLPKKLLVHIGLADVETGELIAKHIRFAFIQTSLFNKKAEECETKFEKIIYTLKNMPTLIAIPFQEAKDDIFARMDSVARYASLSPEERRLYEYELKKSRDRASELNTAREEGLAKGRAEGRAEGRKAEKMEIAKVLKTKGMSDSEIKSVTGLSEKEIADL